MVAVFSGFVMGDLAPLQQFGFGLAVAVIIDATIIRSVLVPASMQLLGKRNWYLPSWLMWLPHISIEAAPLMPGEGLRPESGRPEVAKGPAAGG
jgi:RND superfamily putative drug exporter